MINLGPIIFLVVSLIGYSPQDHQVIYDPGVYQSEVVAVKESVEAMIVPHHIVAMEMLDAMYQRASSDIKELVLISPDHFLDDDRHMTTSFKDWSGDFGKIINNRNLTTKLSNLPGMGVNDHEIETEHGLNVHMPLIKKYFPLASISHVMISKETSIQELDALIAAIPKDIFLIASVDFSHYLSYEQARLNDQVTKNLLLSGNYDSLFELNDGYYDSPGCLYVIFNHQNKTFKIYDNKNLYDYTGIRYNTTSYMTIGFKDN